MGVLQQFLNTVDEAAGVSIVQTSNPVNWSGAARAIASAVFAAVAVGVTNIFGAVGSAYSGLIGGLTEWLVGWTEPAQTGLASGGGEVTVFVDGLIGVTLGRLEGIAAGFWEFNIEQFGVFAGPVAVAIVLLVLYVMSIGYQEAIEQFSGGS